MARFARPRVVGAGVEPPDFTLPGLDGLTYSLHEAIDEGPVVLVFWQAHCGACRMIAPYLNTLFDAYENIGWSYWTIAQDAEQDARAFAQQHSLKATVLVDGPAMTVSEAYDPQETPTIYVVEPGKGVTLEVGGFDKEALNEVSRRIAAYTGSPYVEVAPEDDGNPRFRPG
jgi:peroxiredoxin